MDGIAAIGQRISAIQSTLASLQAPGAAPAAAAATSSGALRSTTAAPQGTSSKDFASVLAGEVSTRSLPSVPGYSSEQVGNAAAILAAGRAKGLSLRDQAIGVMTAMGESSLRVLDHGDAAGPDSRGLFQQRDNGAWGTLAQRMDPTASATNFFAALERVSGRDGMSPTLVAHTVQRNADPNHYTRYWDDAVTIVSRLTGSTPAHITAP